MKLTKRLAAIAACAVMATSSMVSTSAFASDINNVQEYNTQSIEYNFDYENKLSDISDEIQPRDNTFPEPDEVWDLSTMGAYTLDGWGNGNGEIYSSYRFTSSSGTIAYSLANNYPGRDVTIYIYKNGKTKFHRSTLCTIPSDGVKSGLINVDDDDYIVFSFYAPAAVTGTIA